MYLVIWILNDASNPKGRKYRMHFHPKVSLNSDFSKVMLFKCRVNIRGFQSSAVIPTQQLFSFKNLTVLVYSEAFSVPWGLILACTLKRLSVWSFCRAIQFPENRPCLLCYTFCLSENHSWPFCRYPNWHQSSSVWKQSGQISYQNDAFGALD